MPTVEAKGRVFIFSIPDMEHPTVPPETEEHLAEFLASCQGDVKLSSRRRTKNSFEVTCLAVDVKDDQK